jgi:hypothetical protein
MLEAKIELIENVDLILKTKLKQKCDIRWVLFVVTDIYYNLMHLSMYSPDIK